MERNLTILFLLFGVMVFAVGLNSVGDYNRMQDVEEEVDLTGYAKISWVQELQKWNKNNFESTIDAQGNRTMIHEDHAVLTSTVNDLKTEVAILKALGDVTTLPQDTQTDSTTFDLVLADANGNFGNNFNRGEVVLITGKAEEQRQNSRIVITDPNGQTAKDKSFNTYSDGTFTESFITNDQTQIGEYTITITIQGQTDTIKFRVA